jgi:hypothetical protein
MFTRRPRAGTTRAAGSADRQHLEAFAAAHPGVEAYIEPRTTVTEWTVMLVAAGGEWTRRRVPGRREAHELARHLGIPIYDVAAVGYPQRKRDWDAKRRNV